METKKVYRSKEDLKFKKVEQRGKHKHPRAKERKNSEEFVDFILGICQEVVPNLPKDKRYFAPAISCNEKINKYFSDHVDSMIWLCISPKDDNNLEDWEFQVDMENILEERVGRPLI